MRLSEKQKEVIRLMREGYELFTWTNQVKGKRGQLVYSARVYELSNGKTSKPIHHSTLWSLQKLNIIVLVSRPYHLTELGKTTKL